MKNLDPFRHVETLRFYKHHQIKRGWKKEAEETQQEINRLTKAEADYWESFRIINR